MRLMPSGVDAVLTASSAKPQQPGRAEVSFGTAEKRKTRIVLHETSTGRDVPVH